MSECLSNAILVHRLDHGERSQAITSSSGSIRLTQPGVIGLLATEVQKAKKKNPICPERKTITRKCTENQNKKEMETQQRKQNQKEEKRPKNK